jgi:hypothetical protein
MGEDARVGLILLLTLRSDASACLAHAQEVPMSTTLAQEAPMSTTLALTRPATLSTVSADFAGAGLFSLLGLTLSAAVLSYVSSETISLMFSSIG